MNQLATALGFGGAQPYRLTADDYFRIIIAGGFGDAHVELVDGELIESAPFPPEFEAVAHPARGDRPYRICADDYLRMIDAGAFGDTHVELVDGVLIAMPPANTRHGRLMIVLATLLENAYAGTGYQLFGDIITRFDDSNIRAPDLAVVDGDIGERLNLVPGDILLAVEIAHSSLPVDLGRKRIDYASAGIRHYWVVDVDGRRVHTYTDPQGADYAAIRVFAFGDAVPVPGAEGVITVS